MNIAELVKSKPKEAAAAAGVVLVAALAYVKSRRAATPTDPATAGGGLATAGLTGIPNTLSTDIQNSVQDQLNQFQSDVNEQISKIPKTPAGPPSHTPKPFPLPRPKPAQPKPAPPKPAPKPKPLPAKPRPKTAPHPPAWKVFKIPAGGTLYGAAAKIYGHATAANVAQLAAWNGIKLYQKNGTTFADVHVGQSIKYH